MNPDIAERYRQTHSAATPKPNRNYNILGGRKPSLIGRIRLIFAIKHTLQDPSMIAKLKSRKFLVAIVTAVLVTTGDTLGLNHETTQMLVNLAASYIIGQGVVDAATAFKAE